MPPCGNAPPHGPCDVSGRPVTCQGREPACEIATEIALTSPRSSRPHCEAAVGGAALPYKVLCESRRVAVRHRGLGAPSRPTYGILSAGIREAAGRAGHIRGTVRVTPPRELGAARRVLPNCGEKVRNARRDRPPSATCTATRGHATDPRPADGSGGGGAGRSSALCRTAGPGRKAPRGGRSGDRRGVGSVSVPAERPELRLGGGERGDGEPTGRGLGAGRGLRGSSAARCGRCRGRGLPSSPPLGRRGLRPRAACAGCAAGRPGGESGCGNGASVRPGRAAVVARIGRGARRGSVRAGCPSRRLGVSLVANTAKKHPLSWENPRVSRFRPMLPSLLLVFSPRS